MVPATKVDEIHLSAEEMQLGAIVLGQASLQIMAGTLQVNGMLDVPPEQLIAVTALMGGVVVSTSLLQGQHVHAGDVLATIRNPAFIQIQQEYTEIEGKLAFAQQELNRQQELVNDEVAPAKNLQRAVSEYTALKAQLAGAAARLRMVGLPVGAKELVAEATLRAPKEAYVRDVWATVGQSLTATDPLCTLVDPSHLHVELMVFEKDLPSLYIGQPITFYLPNKPAQARKASIYLIGRTVDPTNRTVRVHGHLEDDHPKDLLPGMYVRASVTTSQQKVVCVPDAAVVEFGGKYFVYEKVAGPADKTTFVAVEIRTGLQANGYREVITPPANFLQKKLASAGAYSILSKLKNAQEEE